ncbi:hydroxyacid dehydrogenase [candidate division KSB1 bacterium]|nr:hydroxyacid dehydrogenase [candidate division KSB1 bacterium]
MKILISDAFDPSLSDRLKKFGEVTEDTDLVAECDVVLIRSKTKCTKEYIDAAPNLKLIIRGGVGLDNVDLEYAKEKGIAVHNTPEASSVAVAELAFALMISVPNRIIAAHNSMVDDKWEKKQLKRSELMGKVLGLIGVGRIGTVLANRARAFGMHVVGHDKFVKWSDQVELKEMDSVLGESDYLSLHVPFNADTENLINKKSIAKMKDGVVVINTGRGKCVNAEDMVDALKSGKISTYATDVWPSDPPPADYPLLKAPNVIMTPHIGASTKENLLRIGDQVVEIITNFNK